MDRRTFLKVTVAAGVVGVAGCQEDEGSRESPSTATDAPTDVPSATPGDVNAEQESSLAEVSVDVADGEDVSNVVADVASGERLVFPSGRFTWESPIRVTADDWGIRCQEDTVFEVPAGMGDGAQGKLLRTNHRDKTADNFVLENLTFDSSGRAAPGLHLGARNSARVDGLRYEMNGPMSPRWQENGVHAYVENADGVLRIDDYRQFNNGDLGAYAQGNSRSGIWVGPSNQGTVHLRNPVLQGFPNNACYVSRQPGTVVVEGGLLMNNNVSAVRVSGSVQVHNTTIYIDMDRYVDGAGRLEGPDHNTRGLWGDNRQAGTDGGLVQGVSCIITSYRRCTGLVSILENPRMTVRDSQFLLNTSIEGVRAFDGEIELAGCAFDGRSFDSTAGVGNITGSGNHVEPHINPGDVPIESRYSRFDWRKTHPETPAP